MTDAPPPGPADEAWSPPPLTAPPGPPAPPPDTPPPHSPGGSPPGPGYGYPPAAPPGGPPPGHGAPGPSYGTGPASGYGPPPGYGAGPTAGFGSPAAGYGYPPARRTNGNAIASLVCGVCSLVVCPVISLAGLATGLRARRQISESNGAEDGDGLAIAGLVVNGLGLLYLIGIVVLFALFAWAGTQPARTDGMAPLTTSLATATAFA